MEIVAKAQRLIDDFKQRWAHSHLPVTEILEQSQDDQVSWLMTRAVPGLDATNSIFRDKPIRVVELLSPTPIGLRTTDCSTI